MAHARGAWWRWLAQAIFGLALTTANPAAAAAVDGPGLQAWLTRTTDLASSQIALVSDDLVFSLEPLGAPLPTGEIIVLVRTEPLADDWSTARGFSSWDANLLVDCAQRRLRIIRSATYPQRNRGGRPEPDQQDHEARTPLSTEPAARLLAAACDADFAWPLRASATAAARPVALAEAAPRSPETIDLPPPPSADPAPTRHRWVLQVARGSSDAGARKAVDAARRALGPDAKALTGWTAAAASRTGESRMRAALLGGFPSYVAADSACQALRRAKQDCLVRRMPAGQPAPPTQVAQSAQSAPVAPAAAAPATGPAYAVQIARGPSEDGARRALTRARKTLGPLAKPVRDVVARSRIAGDRLRYDVRLEGFATAEAANRACRTLSSTGQSCFLARL